MIDIILLATGIGLSLYAFYKWATKNNDFFTRRGIQQMKPTFLVGNNGAFITQKMDATEYSLSLYEAFPNERYED